MPINTDQFTDQLIAVTDYSRAIDPREERCVCVCVGGGGGGGGGGGSGVGRVRLLWILPDT